MKSILSGATLAAMSLGASTSGAQYVVREAPPPPAPVTVEVSPTLGYAFQNGIGVPRGSVDVAGSAAFGVDVDVGDWYGARLELAYMLQDSDVRFTPVFGPSQSLYGLTVHHFQAGGEYDFLPGRVRPMAGVTVGAALLSPHAPVADELWFEASLEAGVKILVTRALSVRAQGELTTIFMDATSRVFCAAGCFGPWYGGVATSQLTLAAGPTVVF